MGPGSERRQFERFHHSAPIVFALRGSDQFVDAKLCDFCRRGMGFITTGPIQPGAEIYIMTEHYSPDDFGAEIYDGYLARVRWCEPQTASRRGQYRVGVQYPVTTPFGED
jgi:hypothetical protein